jgi:predicted Zn-dependent protease
MNPTPSFSLNPNNRIARFELIELAEAGFRENENRFVRIICLSWLAAYPGDLYVSYLLGQALLAENKLAMARDIFNRLIKSDPEFAEVQKILSRLGDPVGMAHSIYDIPVPDSRYKSEKSVPEWY